MFTLLNKLTDLDETMKTLISNTNILTEGDADAALAIFETATQEIAKIVQGLKSSDWSPSEEQLNMASAVELLSDGTSREAIADSLKGGSDSIRKLLNAAGDNEKANTILMRLVKQYGQSLPAKVQKEFQNAAQNPDAKKQLTLKYGKLLQTIGQIQSQSKPENTDSESKTDVSKWFN